MIVGGEMSENDQSLSEETGEASRQGWLACFFGIGPADENSARPQSRLVYPLSPFGITWIAITAVFLLYTAVVTPPMIAFCWLDPECAPAPTLYFDVVLDVFFLLDIIFNFNVGLITAGEYEDDRIVIAKKYIGGMLSVSYTHLTLPTN